MSGVCRAPGPRLAAMGGGWMKARAGGAGAGPVTVAVRHVSMGPASSRPSVGLVGLGALARPLGVARLGGFRSRRGGGLAARAASDDSQGVTGPGTVLEEQSVQGEQLAPAVQDELPGDGSFLEKLRNIPNKWVIVITMIAAQMISNMDKVDMSVAILPMASQFGWSNSERGVVLSAFLWGYVLLQIPAGYAASRYGGRYVLAVGMAIWSLATLAAPLAAYFPGHGVEAVAATRFLVGLGQGGAPTAVTALMAEFIPVSERARAVTLVFGGMDAGSAMGLLTAPILINNFNWENVFYVYGAIGFVWLALWPLVFRREEPASVVAAAAAAEAKEDARAEAAAKAKGEGYTKKVKKARDEKNFKTPWMGFASSSALWGLTGLHFCSNWGYYTLLAWLPTYFEQGLGQDVGNSASLTLIPYICLVAATVPMGPLADGLVEGGMPVVRVRKLFTTVHTLGPALMMLILSYIMSGNLGPPEEHVGICVACLCGAFCMYPFSRAALYCNHQDLSPRHSGTLLGITNTFGATASVCGVWAAGALLDMTGRWEIAIFYPMAFFSTLGCCIFWLLGSADQQGWDD